MSQNDPKSRRGRELHHVPDRQSHIHIHIRIAPAAVHLIGNYHYPGTATHNVALVSLLHLVQANLTNSTLRNIDHWKVYFPTSKLIETSLFGISIENEHGSPSSETLILKKS
jgi:hypothetical protein